MTFARIVMDVGTATCTHTASIPSRVMFSMGAVGAISPMVSDEFLIDA